MANLVLFVMVVSPCFLQCFSTGIIQPQLEGKKMEITEKKVNNGAVKFEAFQNFLFGKSDEILNDGFEYASYIIRSLDMKLGGLFIERTNCSERLDFKENIAKVQALAGVLENYYIYSNEIMRDLLVKACEKHPMQYVIRWIHGEMTWDNQIQLLIYDLTHMEPSEELFAWIKLTGLTFIKASILGHACLGVVYANNPHLNEVQEIYKNNARQKLNSIIEEVMQHFKYYIDDPENDQNKIDWMEAASMDTTDIIRAIINPDNQKIVDSVSTQLAANYPWRHWFVASWLEDEEFEGPFFAKAIACDTDLRINLTTSRHVFFASFGHMTSDDFAGNFNECAYEYWLEPRYCGESCTCGEFVKQYQNCSKTLYPEKMPNYNGIFCMDRPNDLKVRVNGLSLNVVPGFKHYFVSLVKVKGGFMITRARPAKFHSTKDIILTPWKCDN